MAISHTFTADGSAVFKANKGTSLIWLYGSYGGGAVNVLLSPKRIIGGDLEDIPFVLVASGGTALLGIIAPTMYEYTADYEVYFSVDLSGSLGADLTVYIQNAEFLQFTAL